MTQWSVVVCALAIGVGASAAEPDRAGNEAATARRLAAISHNPSLLRAFLAEMPKGGDLHNHLGGAIYAESYLQWAADDKLCVATTILAIVTCEPGRTDHVPAGDVLRNSELYNQAIDAMSMRHWNPDLNGHDHFFATFGKLRSLPARLGDMLAEVMSRAASEHVSYLELMIGLDGGTAAALGRATGWDPDPAALRTKLLNAKLKETFAAEVRRRLDAGEARQRELLRCGTSRPDAGCAVTVRYIGQVARAAVKEQVFAEMVAWFEMVGTDPRVVSLNLVNPEDDPTAVRDFSLHMSMLDFLHRQYPSVPLTLHAGELTEGLVSPAALRSHIRESVDVGHAVRIGHGVDVFSEDDAVGLVRELARHKILIETALTSSDQILSVRGNRHPLREYLRYGVPVALVTDDPGVARTSLTQEFVRAVEDHGLNYAALKQMARNSLRYAFADARTKTALQSDLEQAFRAFEQRQAVVSRSRAERTTSRPLN